MDCLSEGSTFSLLVVPKFAMEYPALLVVPRPCVLHFPFGCCLFLLGKCMEAKSISGILHLVRGTAGTCPMRLLCIVARSILRLAGCKTRLDTDHENNRILLAIVLLLRSDCAGSSSINGTGPLRQRNNHVWLHVRAYGHSVGMTHMWW